MMIRSLLTSLALVLVLAPAALAANKTATPPGPPPKPGPLTIPTYPEDPGFAPGKEVKIDDPQTVKGGLSPTAADPTSHFTVYVPKDYDASRPFPLILCYHGMNQDPKVWPFKEITGGKGYIIVGMEYCHPRYLASQPGFELAYIQRLIKYLKGHLNIDLKQIFVGGFSQGGFHTQPVAETLCDSIAGVIIFGAGGGSLNPNFRGKPVLIGAGETDPNRKSAEGAAAAYKRLGAEVTLEIFTGKGHAVDTNNEVVKKWFVDNGPARQARLELAAAEKARAAGRLGPAYTVLTGIAKNPTAGEFQAKAAAAAKEIEADAAKQREEVEALVTARKYDEAKKKLLAIATAYTPSALADAAKARIAEIDKDPVIQANIKQAAIDAKADALEAQALAAEKQKEIAKAIAYYEAYVARYTTATRFKEVQQHLAELKAAKPK